MCSSPFPFSASASMCPPSRSQSTIGCSKPLRAASPIELGKDTCMRSPPPPERCGEWSCSAAACCRSSSAVVAWPLISATCSAV
eukprot:scaffold51851_cov59-Phaeocystis_antarctica.AAC.5